MKVEVNGPDEKMFYQIFAQVCQSLKVPFDRNGFVYLLQKWYREAGRKMQAVHPRDLLKIIRPRGRIVLMRAALEERVALDDPDVATHLSRCLGCRGCESACPSGVPYGHLLEAAREQLAAARPLPLVARLFLWVFARPSVLRAALWFGRLARDTRLASLLAHLPGAAGFPFAMLASTGRKRAPDWSPRTPPTRETVATLDGCVMEGLFTGVNRATERVLAANGYSLCAAPGQQCCGALHVHAGDAATARELAKKNITAFEASGAQPGSYAYYCKVHTHMKGVVTVK